jgi:hypothetical protein
MLDEATMASPAIDTNNGGGQQGGWDPSVPPWDPGMGPPTPDQMVQMGMTPAQQQHFMNTYNNTVLTGLAVGIPALAVGVVAINNPPAVAAIVLRGIVTLVDPDVEELGEGLEAIPRGSPYTTSEPYTPQLYPPPKQ